MSYSNSLLFRKRNNTYNGFLKALSFSRELIANPRQRQEVQPSKMLGGAFFKGVPLNMCLILCFLFIILVFLFMLPRHDTHQCILN